MSTIIMLLTKELVDAIWPKHERNSCSDANVSNGGPNKDGYPDCNRCMGLDCVGEPLARFQVHGTIRIKPDVEELKRRGLAKLTGEEKQALGL